MVKHHTRIYAQKFVRGTTEWKKVVLSFMFKAYNKHCNFEIAIQQTKQA